MTKKNSEGRPTETTWLDNAALTLERVFLRVVRNQVMLTDENGKVVFDDSGRVTITARETRYPIELGRLLIRKGRWWPWIGFGEISLRHYVRTARFVKIGPWQICWRRPE